jgi:hypothetical protein
VIIALHNMWHMFAPQQVYSGGIGNASQTRKVHQIGRFAPVVGQNGPAIHEKFAMQNLALKRGTPVACVEILGL